MNNNSNLNPASEWRVSLAHQLIPFYESQGNIKAAFIHGSTATGIADCHSDIEIAVLWTKLPSEKDLKEFVFSINGADHEIGSYEADKQVLPEKFFFKDMLFDVGHWTIDVIENILKDVTKKYETNIEKQTTISVIQHGIPLVGQTMIQTWQEQTLPYPNGLAKAMVKEYFRFGSLGARQMLAQRNEIPLLYENLVRVVRRVLYVMLAINHIYCSGIKWTQYLTSQMSHSPPDFFERLQEIFNSKPIEGVEIFRRIIEDVFDIVENRMPDIDVEKTRSLFYAPYQYWDKPII